MRLIVRITRGLDKVLVAETFLKIIWHSTVLSAFGSYQ